MALDTTKRHIIFNGYSDNDFDLIMAGNTPILVPIPKKNSLDVAYSNGTIDTSELDGKLYFKDLSLTYTFSTKINTYDDEHDVYYSTTQMNSIAQTKIENVENWLYSGPATLVDSGLLHDLSNAECTDYQVNKIMGSAEWLIEFDVTFKAPYNLDLSTISMPYTPIDRPGRFIIFNDYSSSDLGMQMIGNTPLSSLTAKRSSMEWTHKNGVLDTSHGRNGKTSGKDSMFYQDRTIQYNFIKLFPRHNSQGVAKNVNDLSKELHSFIEVVCSWLFYHPNSGFATIDGNVTYGGTDFMLIDSSWVDPDFNTDVGGTFPCKTLASARVNELKFSKSLLNDCWALTIEVSFTTYPTFFSGSLYIPAPSSSSHKSEVTVPIWEHYSEVATSNTTTDIPMVEFRNVYGMDDSIYIGNSKDIFTITQDWTTYSADESDILLEFEYDIPVYKHTSIESATLVNDPVYVLLTLPDVVEITVNDVAKQYMPYFDISGTYQSSELPSSSYVKLIDPEGTVVYDAGTNPYVTQILVKATDIDNKDHFMVSGNIVLAACDGYSLENETGFTAQELENGEIFISVPVTYWYLQGMFDDKIISEYGLYPNNETATPNQYYILKQKLIDYSGDEPVYGYLSEEYKFINDTAIGDKKFDHPSHYNDSQYTVWLRIPLAVGDGNNYILCDSNKPEGGDIQWL